MLQLTTQQLLYLATVDKTGSLSNAAKTLGVSLSAISQGLTELERRCGVALFQTQGRTKVSNPDAREIYRYAASVVTLTKDMESWLRSTKEGMVGSIHIGMIDVAAVQHYPQLLKSFKAARPDVDLHITVAPSSQLVAKVRSGELALAIIAQPSDALAGIDEIALLKEPMAVYGPKGAAKIKPPQWGPWVTFPQGSHTRRLASEALQKLGCRFEVAAESHQPEVLKEMVALGMGWTVLPLSQAEGHDEIYRASASPLFYRNLVIARREQRTHNPLAESLVKALVNNPQKSKYR